VLDLETNEETKKPLLIIYYNGHAFRSTVTHDFSEIYVHSGQPRVPRSFVALQSMLERANLDRLFLFDCCYSAAALTKGCSEHIVNGVPDIEWKGSENRRPEIDSSVGSAFTQTLLKYPKQGAQRPKGMLVTGLQAYLSLDKNVDKQSPIIQGLWC